MLEKRAWAMKRLDHLRRALMLEPRGHADMYGALLTEPVTEDAHAGMLFMHNEGWSTMCGHGIIAVTTMAIERGLLITAEFRRHLLDAPAGPRRSRPSTHRAAGRASARRDLGGVRQRAVVRLRSGPAGRGWRPRAAGGRRLRRRVLRHRRRRGGGHRRSTPAQLPELRTPAWRSRAKWSASGRSCTRSTRGSAGSTAPSSRRRRSSRSAPAQRHDLRGCRGRSLALRHRARPP